MRGTIIGLALLMTITGASTARAGEELAASAASATSATVATKADAAAAFSPDKAASFARKLSVSSRPAPLVPMYASFAALETYDALSTLRALKSGGSEANPAMSGVVKSPAALLATKAALTGASIFAAEKLWKQHHRGGAIALMAISNGFMSFVAAHNASVLGQLR